MLSIKSQVYKIRYTYSFVILLKDSLNSNYIIVILLEFFLALYQYSSQNVKNTKKLFYIPPLHPATL